MMIEDWEVGALFWRRVDGGDSREAAANKVKQKFLNTLCGADKDTHFLVGTILAHRTSWVAIGVKIRKAKAKATPYPGLFDCLALNEAFPMGQINESEPSLRKCCLISKASVRQPE
jgi:hypothetical protein